MPRIVRPVLALLALLSTARFAPLAAQQDPGARVERLAEGVYVIIHADAVRDWPSGATDWPHGNTGVVIGPEGVLVIDATYFPSRARADIALIRQLTPLPVRYLVNTHWHGDHTHGNGVYRAAFPGLTIVGARRNREYIALNQERRRAYGHADGTPSTETIARLTALLRQGRDSTGHRFTPAETARLTEILAEHRREREELASIEIAPPDLLFDGALTLFLGARRIEIADFGPGNSPADVTVHLPAEGIIFTGDLVVRPVPYAFGTTPLPWIEALRRIEQLRPALVVPGHGEVLRDLDYVSRVRGLLETVRDRVKVAVRRGDTQAAAERNFSLADLRAGFVQGDDPTAVAYWDALLPGLFRDMWGCVAGNRC